MKQDNLNGLEDSISEVLLSNSSFYRESPDDESLYYIDIAPIGALAYEIIKFAANVFGASLPLIASTLWLYKKYFPRAPSADSNLSGKSEETAQLAIEQTNIEEKLDNLRSNAKDPDIRQRLAEDIEKILAYHGWPIGASGSDADQIVSALIRGEHVQPE